MKSGLQHAVLLLGLFSAAAQEKKDEADALTRTTETTTEPLPPLSLVEKIKLKKSGQTEDLSPMLETRVVGGQRVTQESEYPFFVQWADAYCGGSLIHSDIVLSAAHCENTEDPFDTRVFVNGINSEKGVFRHIQQQEAHPLYKMDNNGEGFDYLLLKLDKSALVDDNGRETGAKVVALNRDPAEPRLGDPLVAVGYGLTSENGRNVSPTLQDVTVKYVDDKVCRSQYSSSYMQDLMFCAGVDGGGKDTCQGDSGGPIVDNGVQVGVVSFGIGCARASHNGVYARVSSAVEWIDEMICQMSDDPPASCPPKDDAAGPGEMSLHISYDDFADEVAYTLQQVSNGKVHLFQPFKSNAKDKSTVDLPLTGLEPGEYKLNVGDSARDGICCGSSGNGKFWVTDDGNNKKVYENGGQFGSFVQVTLEVKSNGEIVSKGETTKFDNSWERKEAVPNYPQVIDVVWPGPLPEQPKSINVNVKFDKFPDETSWELSKASGSSWTSMKKFDGKKDGVKSDEVSVQFNDLEPSWYKLVFKDAGKDGICCTYRRGWMAVTGYLLATRRSGLVWGNNGDFGAEISVYFQMNAAGMVNRMSLDAPVVA